MGAAINKIVFMPQRRNIIHYDNEVFLTTKHGSKIQAKFINFNHKFTLVVSHGNAEDIDSSYNWALEKLTRFCKVNVLVYEYTGYAPCETNEEVEFEPSEEYCYNDIEAVYDYMTETLKIEPKNIILYGRSVGSGPSCYLAEKYSIGGLILNCPFMSAFRVVFKFRFTMPGDKFPNIDRIKNINCAVCILHSVKDEIVPFYHGKRLYEACNVAFDPLFIDGTSHNNLDKVTIEVFQHMNKFFKFLDTNYEIE